VPAYLFTYTTPIMPNTCSVIKYGRDAETALAFFASGTMKQNNLRIIKAKAAMTLIKPPEKI
jgi:hypothetical protein